MERAMVAALIFAAIAVAVIAQAWVSWLEHKRRIKALDVIQSALAAGKEPPPQLYEQLEKGPYEVFGLSKRPWAEAIVFGAVAIGFWIAFGAEAPGDQRDKFLLVAGIMSAAALGCAALAIFQPGQKKRDAGR